MIFFVLHVLSNLLPPRVISLVLFHYLARPRFLGRGKHFFLRIQNGRTVGMVLFFCS